MPIDKYQPCPCGSGKKIKFCCSSDIVGELEKIQRMLDGDQRRACLEHVNHVLEKHPGRPSLLSIKAHLETELGDREHAEETVKSFLESSPHSPIALAEQARLLAQEERPLEAVDALQRALKATDAELPSRLYHTILDVALALLDGGLLLAAKAHLLLHASLGGEGDARSTDLLMQLQSTGRIPLLMRQHLRLAPCPEAAPFAEAFAAAMGDVNRACWQAGLEKFETLAERHGREPSIHRNIAILRGYLGRNEEAAKAWRKHAAFTEAESLDDAVEAEALAQLLDEADTAEPVDIVDATFEVHELDRLMETLLASKRTLSLPADVASLASEDSPAPKAVFSLLDRDMPESGEDVTVESVPTSLGDFLIFGRETDKPPRLELTVDRPKLSEVQALLCDLCGELISAEPAVEVVDQTDQLQLAMVWAWRFPDDTPRELRQKLYVEKRRSVLLDVWPTLPQRPLDNKAPQEVQGDAKYRVRLLAAVLLMELHGDDSGWQFDFNELRRKLDLPTAETIDPDEVDVEKIPLVRCARLDAEKLSTEKLSERFQYASLMRAPAAIRNLGMALVKRDESEMEIPREDIYGILARVATSTDDSLSFIEQARQATVEKGQSPARWLIAEMSLQIEIGNGERVRELLQRIQSKHQNEPGIMQSLLSTLAHYGLIDPSTAGGAGAPAPATASPDAAPAGATGGAGGIWTPSSAAGTPAARAQASEETSSEEKKSGLWLPGMD